MMSAATLTGTAEGTVDAHTEELSSAICIKAQF